MVFPVFVTGHHCGELCVRSPDASANSLPGLRDRASLRLRRPGEGLALLRVFPVFVTGHHCGNDTRQQSYTVTWGLPGLRDRASLRPTGDLAQNLVTAGSSRSS